MLEKDIPQVAGSPLSHSAGTNVPRHTRVPVRDSLKMAGIRSDGRSGSQQGVAMYTNQSPLNRAQARFLARLERRRAKKRKK